MLEQSILYKVVIHMEIVWIILPTKKGIHLFAALSWERHREKKKKKKKTRKQENKRQFCEQIVLLSTSAFVDSSD